MAKTNTGSSASGANTDYSGKWQEGPAAKSVVSLSQVLLAPLDAIFKAQVHAARSFLSLVLQLGYPHVPVNEKGEPVDGGTQVYTQEFVFNEREENGKTIVSKAKLPVLSMVPVAPLAVEHAEFDLEFSVSHVFRHTQLQDAEKENVAAEKDKSGKRFNEHRRPWFLVKDPVSLRGVVAPKSEAGGTAESSNNTAIKIRVKVGKQPVPAALDKLLTSMTQMVNVEEKEQPNGNPPPTDDSGTNNVGPAAPAPTQPTTPPSASTPSSQSGTGSGGTLLTDDTDLPQQ
ncbi:MAG: DUF2589 domain-containing protein [Salibacteraceae bacterium]